MKMEVKLLSTIRKIVCATEYIEGKEEESNAIAQMETETLNNILQLATDELYQCFSCLYNLSLKVGIKYDIRILDRIILTNVMHVYRKEELL